MNFHPFSLELENDILDTVYFLLIIGSPVLTVTCTSTESADGVIDMGNFLDQSPGK